MPEYFFELLTEEIPAWMHDAAHKTVQERLAPVLQPLGGDPASITATSTPRRIVVFVPNVPEREADREQEVKGPPKKAAYDASGKPTKALEGFLRKNNAAIGDIVDAGDYVMIRRTVAGRTAAEILGEAIPQIFESIRWPKMMRWGRGEYAYIRPIHSLISIYDCKPLPVTIFGVQSGTSTVGHRTLAPGKIEVGSFNDYVTKLELARVVIDSTRRRHVMAERARVLGMQAGGEPALDVSIWSQWQYLTEYPGLVRAEFRREYLALPEEVLVTVMRVHQKQLPIRTANGKLTNSFIAVLDNDADEEGNAAYGNSFVTNARFADAQFFYETDRKRPLDSRLEQLAHLQFQEKLGNYLEKTKRIEAVVAAICKEASIEANDALEAARLCKTDLVTEMVKEFTDLQGKVGGIYAREEGKPEAVWQAIYDHYLPVNIDDELPRNVAGAVVSLADKIDTLAGFFSIGLKPTGSRDPFALRRAGQGIVQILLNRDKRRVQIGTDKLIEIAFSVQTEPSENAEITKIAKQDLLAFFAERVRTLLEMSRYGFAYDEIAAAMEAGWAKSLPDLVDRIEAVKALRDEANFLSILDSAKRIQNITAGQGSTAVSAAKLEHPTEKRLNELADMANSQIAELIGERHYRDALRSFAAMAPELEKFFVDVMVMVDDEAVRNNRMALLRKIGGAVSQIADVTKIVVDRRVYRS